MSDERAFLTLTHLNDSSRHAEYNAWHQLDHLPENLLLPGVSWGQRWVRTPACAAVSHTPDASLASAQYAVMYAFRSPADIAVQEWTALNRRAIWWGRRPELGWTARRPLGFFEAVKAYAAPRILISPDAVPHRPHLGVHLTVSRVTDPESPAAERLMREYDRDRVPRLLDLDGVAGVLTYRYGDDAGAFGSSGTADGTGLLLRLAYLDADPVATAGTLADAVPEWVLGAGDGEEVLLSSPFAAITPWQWDWFETDD